MKSNKPPPTSNPMSGTFVGFTPEELARLREKTTEGPLPLILETEDTVEISAADIRAARELLRRASLPPTDVLFSEALPDDVDAAIEILDGPADRIRYTLSTIATTVGRRGTVRIDDSKVSRQHAVIAFHRGEFRVRDTGSANGVYLNGAKITDCRLRDSDKLLMGTTTLLFHASRRERPPRI